MNPPAADPLGLGKAKPWTKGSRRGIVGLMVVEIQSASIVLYDWQHRAAGFLLMVS